MKPIVLLTILLGCISCHRDIARYESSISVDSQAFNVECELQLKVVSAVDDAPIDYYTIEYGSSLHEVTSGNNGKVCLDEYDLTDLTIKSIGYDDLVLPAKQLKNAKHGTLYVKLGTWIIR